MTKKQMRSSRKRMMNRPGKNRAYRGPVDLSVMPGFMGGVGTFLAALLGFGRRRTGSR